MKPSEFLSVQRLNTEARLEEQRREKQCGQSRVPCISELLDITQASYQRDSTIPIGRPLFDVFPAELCFQQYKPYQPYRIPLRLRNVDQVVRQVRVVCEASEYFTLIPPAVSALSTAKERPVREKDGEERESVPSGLRVAPGMEVVYTVEFRPDQQADYAHEVTVLTEREKLKIPVWATGSRALLDFPDWVELGDVPVRYECSKTLLVRNLGEREGRFVLMCEPSHVFSATPTEASLDPQQCSQVTVKMQSATVGIQQGVLSVLLDSGEELSVSLRGDTHNAGVRLEHREVRLADTYVGLGSRQEIKLINNSDVLVNFCWKALGSETEEEAEKDNATALLATRQTMAEELFRDESERDERIRDRVSILTRSFKMRQTQLSSDRFHFVDEAVSLDPLEGEVWPHTETLISVRFHPTADEEHSCTAYCEVIGRESRLPLFISGRGLGPRLELSLDQLNIGKVCLCTSHVYELLLRNTGYIPGEYSLLLPSELSPIARSFRFSPAQGLLQPGDVQAVEISFSYPQEHPNKFTEQFEWAVAGASELLKLSITGAVTKPTFSLSQDELNFGMLAYGFPVEQHLSITNTSSVEIACRLHVPQDGELTQDDISVMGPCSSVIKEFKITPDQCSIPSGKSRSVSVEFSPRSVRAYNVRMLLDIVEVSDAVCSIPILAQVRVPTIVPSTQLLNCGSCFVGHTFVREIQLINDDEYPAVYRLQEVTDRCSHLLVSSDQEQGVIPSYQAVTVPLQLQANSIGDNTSLVSICILGSGQLINLEARYQGEGPVVHVTPTTINWGKLPVFVPNTFTVSMSNQAPIPADFACCLATESRVFTVDPETGSIPPHNSQELRITANLNDSIAFSNKLVIRFNHEVTHYVGLEARGRGVTVLASPPITPRMDFGHHYSSSVFKKTFTLTNNGTRTHILTWNVASHAAHRNKKLSSSRLDPLDMANSAKIIASRAATEIPPSVKLVPQEIYLTPGTSSELSLEVYSETPRPVRETLLCYALIGKLTTKQLLLESEISVDFIQPLIRFSHPLLSFSCLQDSKGSVHAQSLSLSLLNISSLPLSTLLSVPPPFSFHSERGLLSELELELDTQEKREVSVNFDPGAREGTHSYRVQEEMVIRYTEHPSQDAFPLTASVHFPNLSFSSQEVDFGTILNDTDTVHRITLHNTSPIEVKFSWCFQEPEQHLTPHPNELEATRVFSDSLDDNTLAVHSPTKPMFQPWGESCDPFGVAPINQLFDILPIHGNLQPDEVMQVEFSYYGRAHSCVSTTAVCSVERGPEYPLLLKGRASSMTYKLSRSVLDISHCHYAKEVLLEVTLYNTGLVDFSFDVRETRWASIPTHSATSSHFILAFEPDSCLLPAGSHETISVRFTPGVPGPFRTEFFLHIAHFQPESVEITGEAVFPNFRFTLPRPNIDRMLQRESTRASSRMYSLSGHESPNLGDADDQETRIEQDVVRKFAISGSRITVDTFEATGSRQLRAVLPAYELDFGYVILGRVCTHTLSLYNPTNFTVSVSLFQPGLLKKSGFNFASHKFADIPPTGALELEVTFDPASVGLSCGSFEIHARFLVTEGPEVPIVLKGEVTLPDLDISAAELNFEEVLVSRCKIITLQLCNSTPVTCTWRAEVPLPPRKVNKFIPLHLKKKSQPPKHAPHFEVIPSSGSVDPGQRLNVKVKFTPSEQLKYSRDLIFRLHDSPDAYHGLLARGIGVEQNLQFSASVLEFGPVLPVSQEVKEVTITNLTPFPCEIYSLEFDPVYLEEEDTLRALGDYDKFGQLMLPPREVGDKLPPEVSEWWERRRLELEALNAPLQSPGADTEPSFPPMKPTFVSTISNDLFQYENANYLERISPASVDFSSLPMLLDSLKNAPNMSAVARHIGILPEESQKQFELGIVFVLNGGPYSGKSTQARLLSEKYCIPVLDLDSILVEAVQQGVLPAAQKARELCVQAGQRGKEEEPEAPDQPAEARDKLAKDKLEPVTQVPSLPPSLEFEIRDPTTEDATQLCSTVLPEELVAEMLSSRVHSNDCFPGLVLDSLDCSFLADTGQVSRVLLRVIGHRELFYFINLEFNPEAASDAKQHREEEEAAKERELLASLSPPLQPDFLELELDLSDEEGYERLDEGQKAALHKSIVNKRRLAREKKRLEEEERRREQELLEQKRQMEEEAKRKGSKKGQKAANALKDGSSDNFKGGLKPSPSGTSIAQQHQQHSPGPAPGSPTQSRPGSVTSDRTIKRAMRNAAIVSKVMEMVPPAPEEDEMSVLYGKFERSLLLARGVVELWDPEKMDAYSPPEPLNPELQSDPAPSRQQRAKKDSKNKDATQVGGDPLAGFEALLQSKPDTVGLPMYTISGIGTQEYIHAQICGLPGILSPVQLLDHLGIGPAAGPKIPAPFELSLVNYPTHRQRPDPPELERRFCFVTTHPDDPNAIDPKAAEEELAKQQPVSPIQEEEKEVAPPPSRKSTQSRASQDSQRASKREVSGKKPHKKKGQKDPRSSTPKISSSLDDSVGPDEIVTTPDVIVPTGPKKLIRHRWVIPGHGSIELGVLFESKEVGNFDETLHFEVMGTHRRYQLYCRGLCAVPGICPDPKVVFPSCKPSRKPNEIVKKKFVLSQDMYDFGPLSYFRSRERRFQGKHPENMEDLTILNDSPLQARVNFKFKDDNSAHTFLLEPPSFTLNPGDKGKLSIWAYPKHPHEFLDTLLCYIDNNPNPVSFKLRAICVKPELKLDRNDFKFDKVLLHRKESRQIFLKNMTLLPVSWKLATGERATAAETDADIYSFNQEQGIVEPLTEFPLVCYFRSPRPAVIKKTLRLEIYSLDSSIGLLTNENLTLQVEAYDVALDISFPKGSDGKLDFSPVRIYEETKQVCHIKNKGKYELHFQFDFETINGVSMKECFEVNPFKGALQAGEKAQPVTFIFNPKQAFNLNNICAMRCHVIDPTYGEIIASIPIHVQAQAVFSEFKVHPVSDINFGPVVIHAPGKQQKTLTIENVGLFEFRYNIVKLSSFISRQRLPDTGSRKTTRAKEEVPLGRTSAKTQTKSKIGSIDQRPEGPQAPVKQNIGAFTLNPTHAIIHPGQSQQVAIECHPENTGTFEEKLIIDVTDKNPNPHPITKVIDMQYVLLCEACAPSIERNVASVFEEHRICKSFKSVSNGSLLLRGVSSGIFFETEKIFRFNTIVVGRQAEARLRIQNTSKVPCDLICINRSAAGSPTRQTKGIGDIFEIEPSKLHLHPHSHKFVTITFRPQAMQLYHCQFAASLEGPGHFSRGLGLNYELQGEGSLPQVTVIQPAATDRSGKPVMIFKRLVVGKSHALPLVLSNTGSMPALMNLQLDEEVDEFVVRAIELPKEVSSQEIDLSASGTSYSQHLVNLIPGDRCKFEVSFSPRKPGDFARRIVLQVQDNPYENTQVLLLAESYADEIVIDNIRGAHVSPQLGVSLDSSLLKPINENLLDFGNCAVGEEKQLVFSISNNSQDVCKLHFDSVPNSLSFSPTTAHLHPSCSKDILLTFKSDKTINLKRSPILCKLQKIKLTDKDSTDWDDRMKVTKWVPVHSGTRHEDDRGSVVSGTHPLHSTSRRGSAVALAPMTASPTVVKRKKITEVEKEPAYQELPNTNRQVELYVTGSADLPRVECSLSRINLVDTMMFQSRKFKFELKNVNQVTAHFEWLLDSPLFPELVPFEPDQPEGLENLYLSIAPASGEILPQEQVSINLKFSPSDVIQLEAKLVVRIRNLPPDSSDIEIPLTGQSVMPYCHFELPTISYSHLASTLDIKTSTASYSTPLNPSTRVLTFESCGVGVKVSKSFHVVNPTNLTYEFLWQPDLKEDVRKPFLCQTKTGSISGGKKFEMTFEYLPSTADSEECLWKFNIPSLALSLPLLFVGYISEPRVLLDRSYLHFKPQLVNQVCRETVFLINDEDSAYSFSVREASCHMPGHQASISVSPMSGSIAPHTRLPLKITLPLKKQAEHSFNLKLDIKHNPEPLVLNVKASAYLTDASLKVRDMTGGEFDVPMDDKHKSELKQSNFGLVQLNEKSLHTLMLCNNGLFAFDYFWQLSEKCFKTGGSESEGGQLVNIKPQTGRLEPQTSCHAELSFCPAVPINLKGCSLVCHIKDGPTFSLGLLGKGIRPSLIFSFTKFNFGLCFLYHPALPPNTVILTITNPEDAQTQISLDILPFSFPHLSINFTPIILNPGTSTEAEITFMPQEPTKYCDAIEFNINGITKQLIEIVGQGTELKLQVTKPPKKLVNFGVIRVNEKVDKNVTITNLSAASVEFGLQIKGPTPPEVLKMIPSENIKLKPNGDSIDIALTFCPTSRLEQFTDEVQFEILRLVRPLFMISGCGQDVHITLGTSHLPFGQVCLNSKSSRQLQLSNKGDIGAHFQWDIEAFKPNFTISPTHGYISPKMEVVFLIEFHPIAINSDIRYENIKCTLEGAKPQYVTLTGMCTEITPRETIPFTTAVRTSDAKQIPLNLTRITNTLHLKPTVEGDFWSGPELIIIEPNQTKNYTITYHPLEMTGDHKKHVGSVFFPLPEGQGILYNLTGVSEPPKPVESRAVEVPSKLKHTELLTVSNWLKTNQRFKVIRDILKPDRPDISLSIQGLDYIDVPGNSKREYQLQFHAFKVGTTYMRVTFRNEETGEFCFYLLTFKAISSGTIEVIKLDTTVRQRVIHTIAVHNPLPIQVSISTNCSLYDISLPAQFLVGAQSEGTCTFEYLPLKAGEVSGEITLTSSDLGLYHYTLQLTAVPRPPEPPVTLVGYLGSTTVQPVSFTSYAKANRVEYTCKVDHADFHVERTVLAASAAGGIEVQVDAQFEPSNLGTINANLTVSSQTGGEYLIPLVGECNFPSPQGPYVIKASHSVSIPFKNVFPVPVTYTYSLDNPAFQLRAVDQLKPKKSYTLTVTFDPKQGDSYGANTGKLIAKCPPGYGGSVSSVSWIFYLKGII